MLNIFIVKRCFWEVKMLFGSLVELHVWLHSCLCFSFLEKLFLSNLDTSRHLAYLSSSSVSFNRNLASFSIAPRSIEKVFVSSIAPRSIELLFAVNTSRHLLDSCIYRPFLKHDTSRHLCLSRISELLYIPSVQFQISYSSISLDCSCLFTSQTSLSLTPNFILKDFSA